MTAQIPDVISINGSRKSLTSCPPVPPPERLDTLEKVPLPPIGIERMVNTTACWRRYQGIWEIRDDRLYFIGMRTGISDGPRESFRLIEPLLADWVLGILVMPEGKLVEYLHMGHASLYQRERYIEVVEGRITDSHELDDPVKITAYRKKMYRQMCSADRMARRSSRKCPHCKDTCLPHWEFCKHCSELLDLRVS